MQVNDLVIITTARGLGIGCIAKKLSKKMRVNVGLNDVLDVAPSKLQLLDTSKCKTVTFDKYRRRIMNVGMQNFNHAIVGNVLQEFVGIGWIDLRVITEEDLMKYPRVID